jgi:hypothetical protein
MPESSSPSGVVIPTHPDIKTNCEYCGQPLPEPKGRVHIGNLKRRRFCDRKCRAIKWKLDHPESWGKYGMPGVVKANLGLPE